MVIQVAQYGIIWSEKAQKYVPGIKGQLVDLATIIGFEEVNDARQKALAGDEKGYDALKQLLPSMTPSTAILSRSRDVTADIAAKYHTGIICLDIDKIGNEQAVELKRKMAQQKGCICAFLSPGGLGTKGLFRVAPIPTTEKEHMTAWHCVVDDVQAKLGITVDPGCKDVKRVCYVSYDADAVYNPNVDTFKHWEGYIYEEERPKGAQTNNSTLGSFDFPTNGGNGNGPQSLDEIRSLLACTGEEGTRYPAMRGAAVDWWTNLLAWERFKDTTPQDLIATFDRFQTRMGIPGKYDHNQLNILIETAMAKFPKAEYVPYEPRKVVVTDSDNPQNENEQTESESESDQSIQAVINTDIADTAGVFEEICCSLGLNIRHNTRSDKPEYRYDGDEFWTEITTGWRAHIRFTIQANYRYMKYDRRARSYYRTPVKWGRDEFRDIILAAGYNNQVDPVQEWLENVVAKIEWDGKERLNSLYDTLFGAGTSPLVQWASRYACIGIIQRTFEPGCQLDEFPVNSGPQNIGKSRSLQWLFPHRYRDSWFSDDIDWDRSHKAFVEATQGKALIEFSEMVGLGRKEIEHMKRVLTSKNDSGTRLAYREDPEERLRRFVWVGTTNSETPLPNDPTGNRRFVVIYLQRGCNVEKYLDENREQLWAEAWHLYQSGVRANLSRSLIKEQALVNEKGRNTDATTEELVEALSPFPMTFKAICEELELIYSDQHGSAQPGDDKGQVRKLMSFTDETRIQTALKICGWTPPTGNTWCKINKAQGRWWTPPEEKGPF